MLKPVIANEMHLCFFQVSKVNNCIQAFWKYCNWGDEFCIDMYVLEDCIKKDSRPVREDLYALYALEYMAS